MATCPRMLGTEWPGERSAVSGRRPPSTTCECFSTSCARAYACLFKQPLVMGKVPEKQLIVIKISESLNRFIITVIIIFRFFITAPQQYFLSSFHQDGFISCRAASSKAKDRTAKEGTQQGSQKDNANSGSYASTSTAPVIYKIRFLKNFLTI